MANTKGKLYLIPTTLGDNEPLEVLPMSVKKIIERTNHYIVENEKSARRFIKKISPRKSQPGLTIHLLDKFTDIYPQSEKAEEAAFLSAKGFYFNSPVYSKEQKETIEAIEKLQLFVNAHPNSQYLSEANAIVKELDFKLEKKAFEIAKQYNLISDYKASIKSFNNFLLEFPGATLYRYWWI